MFESFRKKEASRSETDPAVIKLLERKARTIADTVATAEQITDGEIHDMAQILATHAEQMGDPLDEETIEDPRFESRIIDALDARNKMRGTSTVVVGERDGGAIAGVAMDGSGARKVIEKEKGLENV